MRTLIMTLLILASTGYAQGQERRITGYVFNQATNQPLGGVTIQGQTGSTTSDDKGNFSLSASSGEVLHLSFVGMAPATLKITGSKVSYQIGMQEASNPLNEVVVTGYKTEKKKDLTGAVSVVNLKQTLAESNPNILTSLQGRVPGLEVESDGTPGGNGTSVKIRGFSTLNDNGPLYVIDGVPTTYIGALNPQDIESIQVLKDAASASIYGSRANNGVIVITTRKGKSSTAKVTFDAFYGVQTLANRIHMLNAQQWGQVYWQAEQNSGITPQHSQYGSGAQPVIPAYLSGPGPGEKAANTDWIGAIFHPASIQNYNLGVSQATAKSNYYLGVSYDRNDGIMRYTNYERFSSRLNSSFNIKNAVTVGENVFVANFSEVKSNSGIMTDAILQHPLIPLYDTAGNFGGPKDGLGDKLNPLGELYRNRNNATHNWRIFGNVYAEANILKNLTAKTSFAVDYNSTNYRNFTPRFTEGRFNITDNFLTTGNSDGLSWTWSNTVNYRKTFGPHTIEVLAGVEAIKNTSSYFSATAQDLLLDAYNYAYLSNGTVTGANGGATGNQLFSQFGKINYNYQDKYLLAGTLRRDGSSRFGTSNQYGVFPALSGGWRISQEKFFQGLSFINDLKLRASWGKTGNQEIPDFGTLNFYKTSPEFANYDLAGANTSAEQAFYVTQIGNPNLRWEENTQTDIGLDATALSNRVTLSADWYNRNTNGILINPVLLAVYGGGAAPFINAGQIQNRGIELALGYNSRPTSPFHYTADFNIAFNQNKVLSLGEGNQFFLGAAANRIVPGQPVSVFYGYVVQGIYKSQADVDKSANQPGKGLGRLQYKDLNGDGVIDDKDRTYVGNPNPKFTYGLNLSADYKGFDGAVFITGVYGNKIYNAIRAQTDFAYFPFNFSTRVLDAWSPSNPNSTIPAVNVNNTNDELRPSTYFVEDGSYLKIKSIQIGYTLPHAAMRRLGIDRFRVYVQGQNLFTFTKYTGMDPEVSAGGPLSEGVDAQFYPHAKSINFGVNVSF
jgi:TonB-dependent starch-binding outer membrane protein SusC